MIFQREVPYNIRKVTKIKYLFIFFIRMFDELNHLNEKLFLVGCKIKTKNDNVDKLFIVRDAGVR